MQRLVVVDKQVGQTPLVAVQEWKIQNPTYADVPACYAGRLDPMASGKLLVLLGEECKQQRIYRDLDKEYEIEVLLDIGSDTGDVLGMPDLAARVSSVDIPTLTRTLKKDLGAQVRPYPVFSSKTVQGKPLFLYALEGTLDDIKVPEHIEHIYAVQLQGIHTLSPRELETRIAHMLDSVPRTNEPSKRLGKNFRIDAIRANWKTLFETVYERNYTVLRLKVVCASGTYMRTLAGRIGESLKTKALALSIKRTRIGKYRFLWCGVGWWSRTY